MKTTDETLDTFLVILFIIMGIFLLFGCTKEDIYPIEPTYKVELEKDTFYAVGPVMDTDTISFTAFLKKKGELWVALYKWQDTLYLPFTAVQESFNMGFAEYDFRRVSGNDGNMVRGVLEIKLPCIKKKQEALQFTKKLGVNLESWLKPLPWWVENIECYNIENQ